MKITVSIVLFLFISFIALPTIIGVLLNDDTDMSMIFNMTEEEEVHKTFTVKEAIKTQRQVFAFHFELPISKKIITENHIQYDAVLEEIFSPPPEVY